MSINITLNSHANEVLKALKDQSEAALEAVGNQAVSHAKQNITSAGRVDTGAMRNSIEHKVDVGEKAVYIGTNQSYAIYHELGTGIYTPGGRTSPWFYVDAKGVGHYTRGIKPIHFLKNAAEDHAQEYVAIIKKHLSK